MKKGSNIEIAIIVIFFLIFIMWMISKCSAARSIEALKAPTTTSLDTTGIVLPEKTIEKPTVKTEVLTTKTILQPAKTTTIQNPVTTAPTAELKVVPLEVPKKPTAPLIKAPEQNSLYVVIDNLNVRKTPNLKGVSLGKLRLYDKVIFLNVVTDKPQKVNLGAEVANERWVKIKTKKGTVGWVYGAGVNYYKMKRKGNL
jgi:Bacterial SH3 domain